MVKPIITCAMEGYLLKHSGKDGADVFGHDKFDKHDSNVNDGCTSNTFRLEWWSDKVCSG